MFFKTSFSQGFGYSEFYVANKTGSTFSGGHEIKIRIYPVGAVYNYLEQYSADIKGTPLPNHFKYLLGFDTLLSNDETQYYIALGQFDSDDNSTECKFGLGIGLYKIEFIENYGFDSLVNYCYVDWRDANIYNPTFPTIDLGLKYFNKDSIRFHWAVQGSNPELNIDSAGHYIKVWQFMGSSLHNNNNPSLGIFTVDTLYSKWPIYANQYNGNIGHENPGDLGMNLVINHNVTTRDTLSAPSTILIPEKGFLKINPEKTFNLKTAVGSSMNLIVQDSSSLQLEPASHLIVGNNNVLTLKRLGKILFLHPSGSSYDTSPQILIQSGGMFCNEGGKIIGGSIVFEKGTYPHPYCGPVLDNYFGDSTKFVLLDSAVMEIPDSTILHFSGNQSGMILKPYSKLKLGVGCKIIFDSSASLIANGATFTSLDSNLKWDGIFLSNSDTDTITNCTFSNAVTALTITNDANSAYKNRIITNNTFNIPNGGIHKGI